LTPRCSQYTASAIIFSRLCSESANNKDEPEEDEDEDEEEEEDEEEDEEDDAVDIVFGLSPRTTITTVTARGGKRE